MMDMLLTCRYALRVQELNRLNSVQISGSAYAFRATEHFMEGR